MARIGHFASSHGKKVGISKKKVFTKVRTRSCFIPLPPSWNQWKNANYPSMFNIDTVDRHHRT